MNSTLNFIVTSVNTHEELQKVLVDINKDYEKKLKEIVEDTDLKIRQFTSHLNLAVSSQLALRFITEKSLRDNRDNMIGNLLSKRNELCNFAVSTYAKKREEETKKITEEALKSLDIAMSSNPPPQKPAPKQIDSKKMPVSISDVPLPVLNETSSGTATNLKSQDTLQLQVNDIILESNKMSLEKNAYLQKMINVFIVNNQPEQALQLFHKLSWDIEYSHCFTKILDSFIFCRKPEEAFQALTNYPKMLMEKGDYLRKILQLAVQEKNSTLIEKLKESLKSFISFN